MCAVVLLRDGTSTSCLEMALARLMNGQSKSGENLNCKTEVKDQRMKEVD